MPKEEEVKPYELRQIGGEAIRVQGMTDAEATERNDVLELDGKSYRWFCLGAGKGKKANGEAKTAQDILQEAA